MKDYWQDIGRGFGLWVTPQSAKLFAASVGLPISGTVMIGRCNGAVESPASAQTAGGGRSGSSRRDGISSDRNRDRVVGGCGVPL